MTWVADRRLGTLAERAADVLRIEAAEPLETLAAEALEILLPLRRPEVAAAEVTERGLDAEREAIPTPRAPLESSIPARGVIAPRPAPAPASPLAGIDRDDLPGPPADEEPRIRRGAARSQGAGAVALAEERRTPPERTPLNACTPPAAPPPPPRSLGRMTRRPVEDETPAEPPLDPPGKAGEPPGEEKELDGNLRIEPPSAPSGRPMLERPSRLGPEDRTRPLNPGELWTLGGGELLSVGG